MKGESKNPLRRELLAILFLYGVIAILPLLIGATCSAGLN